MLDQFDFVNLVGTRLQLNTVNIPLNHVDFELNSRTSRRNKAQAHGTWPGHTFFGECLVHTEGQILETDSTAFNIRKLNLLNTILPDPLTFLPDYPLGRLEVKLTGMTETAFGDCTIDGDISIPMEGLSPARAPLQITWVVFKGYFIGISTGQTYWIK